MAGNDSAGNFRLPSDVLPVHYDLSIKTDLEKEIFEGLVNIELDIRKDTSRLVFNTLDLEVSDVSLYSHVLNATQVDISRSFDSKAGRGTLVFPKELPANTKANLSINFSGKLSGERLGYFKSSYEDAGKQKVYSITHFEPVDARRAFPCWDEPLYKATFSVTMISRTNTVNLCNMPVAFEEIYKTEVDRYENTAPNLAKLFATLSTNEWKITKFETSPPMSTYLVAYANGPFVHLESTYQSPLTGKIRLLRVYGTSDVIGQARYVLDVKAKVLPLYEQLFDIEYPLPKLDTLVSHNFDAGAMENWGLITGRTTVLLMDPERPDMTTRQLVAKVQSHEVAHMWFGNIATMEWWDYLYLNEGFATLMGEIVSIEKIHPEWKSDSQFITNYMNKALDLDAKLSSHPIEVRCPDANMINQIFDLLSYAKAASVLRMLYRFIGQERFFKGVSIYLKDHLYGNTTTKDLWDGINKALNTPDEVSIDVSEMMRSWIMEVGFPLLSVTETEEGVRVRQDRFLVSGPAEGKDNQTIWSIPLAVLTTDTLGNPSVNNIVLSARETTLAIDPTRTYKLNAGTYHVYRVLYPQERLVRIAREATEGDVIFSLNDRIGLVHDALAFGKSGHATVSSALTVIHIFRNEPEFLVWDSIAENLAELISTWWEHEDIVCGLDEFRKGLFKPIVDRLGYQYPSSESPDISQLRTRSIEQAAFAGDPAVVDTLREMFKAYMATKDESKIPADIFRITAVTAVKYGGPEEYNFVKALYEDVATSAVVTQIATHAMCSSQDEVCQSDVEEYTLKKAQPQDVIYFFSGMKANNVTRRRSAQLFMSNFQTFEERYSNSMSFPHMIRGVFSALSTEADIKLINSFFEGRDTSKYNLALQQTLEEIRASVAWIERSTTDISDWLTNHGGK